MRRELVKRANQCIFQEDDGRHKMLRKFSTGMHMHGTCRLALNAFGAITSRELGHFVHAPAKFPSPG